MHHKSPHDSQRRLLLDGGDGWQASEVPAVYKSAATESGSAVKQPAAGGRGCYSMNPCCGQKLLTFDNHV